jgi:pimeloyl-ACP methyl ester carboxylesterase
MPTVKLNTGIDLYYESLGAGEALVFIPATGFSGNVWDHFQVPALSKHVRVITFDPRGCGRSSHPKGVYSLDQMACDVAALLDHLGLSSAHVIGHSMGGRIGLALSLAYPGRVRSLIMAAGGSGPAARSGEDCVPGLPVFLVAELVEKGFDEFVRHEICESTAYFTAGYRKQHPGEVRAFFDHAWKLHARWPEYLRLCIARHSWEATHRLGNVMVPTLVVIGDDDTVGSNHVTQAKVMAERIPEAEYLVLKGQSHGFFWQAPEETNAWILDWVKRHAG